jgi:hypothetical protein
MGAIMVPTVCKRRSQLHNDASGNTCMELLQAMLKELKPFRSFLMQNFSIIGPLEKCILKVKKSFKIWLSA